MQTHWLGGIWQRSLCRALPMLGRRRAHDRIALLLRLENLDLLSERLGQAGMAHVLTQISMRMIDTIRPEDFVQNASPGIFTLLLRTHSEVAALRIAERLQQKCQADLPVNGGTITPVISGVLVQNIGPRAATARQLMTCGLHHLANAGADDLGRLRLIAHEDCNSRDSIPATVGAAVEQDQIEAFFQPQICCDTGEVSGFEALARWRHPARGLIGPGDFMPGMRPADHAALTRAMLLQCLDALHLWDAQGWAVRTVSLNVPPSDLSDPGFADMVLWELERHDIAPHRLVIEVLESIGPINSGGQIRTNLHRLSRAGCLLDLDDFGTGYACLESLSQFGINRIKIDRSFVSDCHRTPDRQRMILAILAMAETLGITTLAEGVETAEEHSYLAQIGCGHVQGYAIARPMPQSEIGSFMQAHLAKRHKLPELGRRKAG